MGRTYSRNLEQRSEIGQKELFLKKGPKNVTEVSNV